MSRERIKLAEAEAKQLRDFAAIALGLELSGNETRQVMISKISEAGYTAEDFPDFSTPVSSHVGESQASDPNPGYRVGEDGVPERQIMIPESDKPGGNEPVQVGVNGKLILIPRGKPVWVDEPYVEVLRNAVEYVYDEFTGQRAENGMDIGGLGKPREVMSYPFQTL